ncbi:MAG: Hint domain-containing protein [Paracoccaceae bacterium]|nr:Hint domain-containing protein [Paracoccaceae bacterium]
MPTTYTDQFYTFDPANPPPAGTAVTFVQFTLTDENDDGDIDRFNGDSVNGVDVSQSWPGDVVTIDVPGVGQVTYTGTTFYLADGSRVFTPTDGQVLQNGTFVSASFVTTQGPLIPATDLGPPCFAAGTRITTPDGPRAVETLKAGDAVVTRDNGTERLRWTGFREVEGRGRHAPVRFATGSIGNGAPLVVSPQHRMVVRGWRAELLSGHAEMLVAAAHLVNERTVTRMPVPAIRYHHIMCAGHEIVFAEGAETETLDPAGAAARAEREIMAHAPGMNPAAPTALPAARSFEARLLTG